MKTALGFFTRILFSDQRRTSPPMKRAPRVGPLSFFWRLGFGVWDFPPHFTRALVVVLALVSGGRAHAQRATPHIGFVYPAGGQQGQTFTVSLGGQTLGGATDAYISGAGVHAKVINYERPFSQKEINDLREKLQQLQENPK